MYLETVTSHNQLSYYFKNYSEDSKRSCDLFKPTITVYCDNIFDSIQTNIQGNNPCYICTESIWVTTGKNEKNDLSNATFDKGAIGKFPGTQYTILVARAARPSVL